MSIDAFEVSIPDLDGQRLLDVRRSAVFEQADTVIPGAAWFDPQSVDAWAASLPLNEAVVVYCVHGHEVSRNTASRLRAFGIDARFLSGGIEAWKSAGRPLQAKGSAA